MRKPLTALLLVGILAAVPMLFQACSDAEDMLSPHHFDGLRNIQISPDFNYETVTTLHLDLTVINVDGSPKDRCVVTVYHGDPTDTLIEILRIGRGVTDANGHLVMDLSVPTYLSEVYITANVMGVANQGFFPIGDGTIVHTFGPGGSGGMMQSMHRRGPVVKPSSPRSALSHDWQYLGTWDDDGVPDYLSPIQTDFPQSFFNTLSGTIQEGIDLTGTHPEYFGDDVQNNINFTCDVDSVVVTFVSDGASWQNALGFYPYPINNPPPGISQLQPKLTLFPNASLEGMGGGLEPGDRVVLERAEFNQNYSMGFFIVADGWIGDPDMVGQGNWTNWSVDDYNPQDNRHFVLLHDSANERLIMAVEDWKRNQPHSDSDFNDCIVTVEVYPFCVDTTGLPNIDIPYEGDDDSDDDGVDDDYDDYPDDPDKAFDNYFQTSVAFEDLWPVEGNYDMNDLVVQFITNQITNGDNLVTFIEADITIKAVGAEYHNGFAFELPIPASDVISITGSESTGDVFNFSGSSPESGPTNAVIPVFDDTRDIITPVSGWTYVNTEYGAPSQTAPTISIVIEIEPTAPADLGAAPYNPFIVVNGNRGKEVHLPGYAPTNLADDSFFGEGDDTTDPATERYYKNVDNLPWAILVPTDWQHMMAGEEITSGYLYFRDWAESDGVQYTDWYLDEPGYINTSVVWSE